MTEVIELKMSSDKVRVCSTYHRDARYVLYRGDCSDLMKSMPDKSVDLTITSPPYCMGKSYERSKNVQDFINIIQLTAPEIVRLTKNSGHICWQVGYHVRNNIAVPLDFIVLKIMEQFQGVTLRNRIIWTFGHGTHSRKRFSGRHETIMWFTKESDYYFDLDAVRIPQKYRGKRFHKGPNKGKYSGHLLGKNPSDVWDIPNVKAHHPEKTEHPCQFPIELAKRLVDALCPPLGVVLDPFAGVGTSGAAAALAGRRFVGAEMSPAFARIARRRIKAAAKGTLRYRKEYTPIYEPNPNHAVVRRLDEDGA